MKRILTTVIALICFGIVPKVVLGDSWRLHGVPSAIVGQVPSGQRGTYSSPPVILIRYGNDPALEKSNRKEVLSGCPVAIPIEHMAYPKRVGTAEIPKFIEDFKKDIARRSYPKDTIFHIIGHGSELGFLRKENIHGLGPFDPADFKEKFHKEGTPVLGDEMVKAIHSSVAESAVWVGSCFSGACSVTTGCVGVECKKDSLASTQQLAWQKIAGLICSARSDCALFNFLDENHDSVLDQKEISPILGRRMMNLQRVVRKSEKEVQEETKKAKMACEQKSLEEHEFYSGPIRKVALVRFDVDPKNKTDWGAQSEEYYEYKTPSDLQGITSFYPGWPKDCTPMSWKGISSGVRRNCHISEAGWARVNSCYPKSVDYDPEVRTFRIPSPRCRETWRRESETNRSLVPFLRGIPSRTDPFIPPDPRLGPP